MCIYSYSNWKTQRWSGDCRTCTNTKGTCSQKTDLVAPWLSQVFWLQDSIHVNTKTRIWGEGFSGKEDELVWRRNCSPASVHCHGCVQHVRKCKETPAWPYSVFVCALSCIKPSFKLWAPERAGTKRGMKGLLWPQWTLTAQSKLGHRCPYLNLHTSPPPSTHPCWKGIFKFMSLLDANWILRFDLDIHCAWTLLMKFLQSPWQWSSLQAGRTERRCGAFECSQALIKYWYPCQNMNINNELYLLHCLYHERNSLACKWWQFHWLCIRRGERKEAEEWVDKKLKGRSGGSLWTQKAYFWILCSLAHKRFSMTSFFYRLPVSLFCVLFNQGTMP